MSRYNNWEQELEDDPSSFERIRKSPPHRLNRKRQILRDNSAESKREIWTAKRLLGAADAQRIGGVVGHLLDNETQLLSKSTKSVRHGVTLLAPRLARLIYHNYYHAPNDNGAGLKEFNTKVKEFVGDEPNCSIPINAELGRIIIIGSKTRYVSAKIINGSPLSAQAMREERAEFQYYLTGDEHFSQDGINNPTAPHLTLARFKLLEPARVAQGLLAKDAALFAEPITICPPTITKEPLY